jgi:hypothetical protein
MNGTQANVILAQFLVRSTPNNGSAGLTLPGPDYRRDRYVDARKTAEPVSEGN